MNKINKEEICQVMMPRMRSLRATRCRTQPGQTTANTVCRYQHHFCQMERLEGFSLCQMHILEDRSASYRPCSFIYGNGRKCGVPVPKKDSHHQCAEHRRRLMLARERCERTKQPAESLDTLAEQLQEGQTADPQTSGEAWEAAQRPLRYRSDTSSDEEEGDRVVESPLEQGLSSDDADVGLSSEDDDDDDLLRHAGVYTDEEVVRLAEQKLRRLQRLYRGQFQRLQHVLQTKRRAYLIEVAREKETMKSISGAPREATSEQQAYSRLRAYGHYQRPAGKDYLFWHHRNEKRAAEAGGPARTPAFTRCAHAEGRVRCGQRTVPLSKFCLKHILEDQHQVLFRRCGDGGPDEPCQTPVAALRTESRCPLHTLLPAEGAVRLPQVQDPVEAMFGLADGDDLLLDESQSSLVASIANTLMASAEARAGGATEPPLGGADTVEPCDLVSAATAGSAGVKSDTTSEVDVTGDTRSASPSDAGQEGAGADPTQPGEADVTGAAGDCAGPEMVEQAAEE
ncbi:KAT8 regulatory NSL complex subunit 2-like [Pollicipes pollicipes]|uniref:KAT8 regulatory NSL complex subunit 2-like n=1 Tax=Pollicipes pollicipes TaxID=41117 RepID=UPI001885502F|nr:KAT8 regulatory NSL complex subunit 2-like [Pollicipes pollicipes]